MVVTQDETALVAKAKSGDRDAYTDLIERHKNLVYGLAYSELGSFEDAQDVAQETFISAWRKLSLLQDVKQFTAWLRQIARNECRMLARKSRPTEILDPEAALAERTSLEDRILAEQALAQLSGTNREAFLLFTFHSFSLQEVADFLGISLTAVMSRIRNARAQLRKDMEHTINQAVDANRLPEDFATRIPVPYDEYDRAGIDLSTIQPLNPFREQWLLSLFPEGTTIKELEEAGSEQTRVILHVPGRDEVAANLHTSSRKRGIETEAALLPLFQSAGIVTPDLLGEPTIDPASKEMGTISAVSDPPGVQNIFQWCSDLSPKKINQGVQLIFEWMDRVRDLTGAVLASPAAGVIETVTLQEELTRTIKIGGPWMQHGKFASAVEKVKPYVEKVTDQPILSLAGLGGSSLRLDEDGVPVGLCNLKWARLEDPHYEITKAWVYDMWPFIHSGIVERYLVRYGLTMTDFAPRLVVRALVTIQRELPLEGGDPWYRDWLFGWLRIGLDNLDQVRPFRYPPLAGE